MDDCYCTEANEDPECEQQTRRRRYNTYSIELLYPPTFSPSVSPTSSPTEPPILPATEEPSEAVEEFLDDIELKSAVKNLIDYDVMDDIVRAALEITAENSLPFATDILEQGLERFESAEKLESVVLQRMQQIDFAQELHNVFDNRIVPAVTDNARIAAIIGKIVQIIKPGGIIKKFCFIFGPLKFACKAFINGLDFPAGVEHASLIELSHMEIETHVREAADPLFEHLSEGDRFDAILETLVSELITGFNLHEALHNTALTLVREADFQSMIPQAVETAMEGTDFGDLLSDLVDDDAEDIDLDDFVSEATWEISHHLRYNQGIIAMLPSMDKDVLFDAAKAEFENVDFAEIGKSVADSVKDIVEDLDMKPHLEECLENIVDSVDWGRFAKNAFKHMLDNFNWGDALTGKRKRKKDKKKKKKGRRELFFKKMLKKKAEKFKEEAIPALENLLESNDTAGSINQGLEDIVDSVFGSMGGNVVGDINIGEKFVDGAELLLEQGLEHIGDEPDYQWISEQMYEPFKEELLRNFEPQYTENSVSSSLSMPGKGEGVLFILAFLIMSTIWFSCCKSTKSEYEPLLIEI